MDDHTAELRRLALQAAQEAAEQTAQRFAVLKREDVEDIVEETISRMFERLGMTTNDPLEMQKDMLHLRRWRESMESVQSKGILTLVGIAVTGVAAAVWLGLKELLNK